MEKTIPQLLHERLNESIQYSLLDYRYEPTTEEEIYSTKYHDLVPTIVSEVVYCLQDVPLKKDSGFILSCEFKDNIFEMRVSEIQ